jgi:hypothetical protein
MKYLSLLIIITSSLFSQIEFEEIIVAGSQRIDLLRIKGDSVFADGYSTSSKPNFYFSKDGGSSFEIVNQKLFDNPDVGSNFENSYQTFKSKTYFHHTLFRYIIPIEQNGKKYFLHLSPEGKTIKKVETQFIGNRRDFYYSPNDTNLIYFSDIGKQVSPHSLGNDFLAYSTDGGATFKEIKPEYLQRISPRILANVNIRDPYLLKISYSNEDGDGNFYGGDRFLYNIKTKEYYSNYNVDSYDRGKSYYHFNQWGLLDTNIYFKHNLPYDSVKGRPIKLENVDVKQNIDNNVKKLYTLSTKKYTGYDDEELKVNNNLSSDLNFFLREHISSPYLLNGNSYNIQDLFYYNFLNPNHQVFALNCYNKNNPNIYENQLVFRSKDNGENWELIYNHDTQSNLFQIGGILIDPVTDKVWMRIDSNRYSQNQFRFLRESTRLYKEKGTNTSVENQNEEEDKVYFIENRLIIESEETNRNELISIYNLSGDLFFRENKNLNKGMNEILVPQVSSGLYLIMIGNKNKTYKLIKV